MERRSSASALCTPRAKYSETACCPALSTLTPKRFFFCRNGRIFARWSTQTRISGGSSETEVKELAVMPRIFPGSRSTVITVTPVENWPSALRNSRVVSGEVVIFEVFEDTILSGGKAKRRGEIGARDHDAKNRDFGGNGSGRLRAGLSLGEGG